MKNLIFLVVIFIFSCAKEECVNRRLIVETNQEEAQKKCNGFANSYPAFKQISSSSLGCLTDEDLRKVLTQQNSTSVQLCPNVSATTRTVIR